MIKIFIEACIVGQLIAPDEMIFISKAGKVEESLHC